MHVRYVGAFRCERVSEGEQRPGIGRGDVKSPAGVVEQRRDLPRRGAGQQGGGPWRTVEPVDPPEVEPEQESDAE